jgi:hypothetical protein
LSARQQGIDKFWPTLFRSFFFSPFISLINASRLRGAGLSDSKAQMFKKGVKKRQSTTIYAKLFLPRLSPILRQHRPAPKKLAGFSRPSFTPTPPAQRSNIGTLIACRIVSSVAAQVVDVLEASSFHQSLRERDDKIQARVYLA